MPVELIADQARRSFVALNRIIKDEGSGRNKNFEKTFYGREEIYLNLGKNIDREEEEGNDIVRSASGF